MAGREMNELKSKINSYLNDKVNEKEVLQSSPIFKNLRMPIKNDRLKVDDEGQVMLVEKKSKSQYIN